MITTNQQIETTPELDLKTIRERVAAIKRNWTPAEARQRASEGRQRRKQLESLIRSLETECEQDDFTLVC